MLKDFNARMLVVPAALPGRILSAFVGKGQKLVDKGRISSQHRVAAGDGVEIDVWVINSRVHTNKNENSSSSTANSQGTVVLLHPLLCSKVWFYTFGRKLADRGWDVVLPDLRAHGESGGQYITWGAKEKHDIKAVMDFLVGKKIVSESIYVVGSSMGAAVAIQYAAIEPRCRGVPRRTRRGDRHHIFRRILGLASIKDLSEATEEAAWLADFNPDDASTEAAAGRLNCPLLLIHGLCDIIVPRSHSEAIYLAAKQPKKFRTQFLHGHNPEFFRDGWLIRQFNALLKLEDGES